MYLFSKKLIFFFFFLVLLFGFVFNFKLYAEENNNNNQTRIFIATVIDAQELQEYNKAPNSNTQLVTLAVQVETENGIRNENIEVSFVFPNDEFKNPLQIGDVILIESTYNLDTQKFLNFVSYYRQNNLLVWLIILFGLYLVISGFKNNFKYIFVILIFLVSSLIIILLYKKNTYLLFLSLFLWQLLASYFFAYRIFRNNLSSIFLSASIFINQLITMLLVYFMSIINLFDFGIFDIFFRYDTGTRQIIMYVFAIIVTFPISVILAEELISSAIHDKHIDKSILKSTLAKNSLKRGLKILNNIFLFIFSFFFSIGVSIIAISSYEGVFLLQVVNSASFTRFISLGLLVLFNVLIFVPLISAMIAILFGKVDSHKLISDKSFKFLEIFK